MILILASDKFDQSINHVVDWLIYYKADFLKLTVSDIWDPQNKFKIDFQNNCIKYKEIDLTKRVQVVWYNRFKSFNQLFNNETNTFFDQINKELNSEIETLTNYLYDNLKEKKWFPALDKIKVNKLSMLNHAMKCGFNVPRTKILTSVDELKTFFQNVNADSMVVKQFSDNSRGYYVDNDITYFSFAKSLMKEDLIEVPSFFKPTLFQERIKAEYELRVFYLEGKCYTSAFVFNYDDKIVDKKQISEENKTYIVPYKLPKNIIQKIDALMMNQGITTGSLDLLKSIDGNYYFLEINPIGQFLNESDKCFYHLPKILAEHLISNDYE